MTERDLAESSPARGPCDNDPGELGRDIAVGGVFHDEVPLEVLAQQRRSDRAARQRAAGRPRDHPDIGDDAPHLDQHEPVGRPAPPRELGDIGGHQPVEPALAVFAGDRDGPQPLRAEDQRAIGCSL